MEIIRLCSAAIAAIPEKHTLVTMWEDNNLEAYEDARTFALWLGKRAPGAFVLIEQWNNVDAPCFERGWRHRADCGVYQPDYALLLVPMAVWQAAKQDALGVQTEHEAAGRRCKRE